jgi:hypothetical protein
MSAGSQLIWRKYFRTSSWQVVLAVEKVALLMDVIAAH